MPIEDTNKTPDTIFMPLQVKAFETQLDINYIREMFNMSITFHA